jgi:hypothetical protein
MACQDNCPPTFFIQSQYSGSDCLGNDYRLGFNNGLRYYGRFFLLRQEQETQERGRSEYVYDRVVKEVWKLQLTRPLADKSFALTRLLRSILLGRNITVTTSDGPEGGFIFTGSVAKSPESGINKDWFISLELERRLCRLNDNC